MAIENDPQRPNLVSDSDAGALEYVGFWLRAWATMVDSALITVILVPMLLAVYAPDRILSGQGMNSSVALLVNYVLPTAAVLLFWVWKSATPGKMMIGAQIVDAATGEKPSQLQFVIRYFSYGLSTIPFGLGFLWVAFDSRKQAWHDKLAGTVVVRPRRGGTAARFGQ